MGDKLRRGKERMPAGLGGLLGPAEFALFLLLAFAGHAKALDCTKLQYRLHTFVAETLAVGGHLRYYLEVGKPIVLYRYDASGREMRLLTVTPEVFSCIADYLEGMGALDGAEREPLRAEDRSRKGSHVAQGVSTLPTFEENDFDVADLNGDGFRDSVAVGNGSVMNIFRGNSTETLTYSGNVGIGGFPQRVLLADLNGDSVQDAAVIRAGAGSGDVGGLSVLLGNGNGTFAAAASSPAGANPAVMTKGDFNADGKLDLAVGYAGVFSPPAPAGVAVLLGNGNGTFQAPATFQAANGVSAILAADLTGDGKLDLALGNNQANTITVFPGNGSGGFGAGVPNQIQAGPEYLVAMDLNKDGKLDLVSQMTILNGLSLHYGNGNGTFQTPQRMAAGNNASSFVPLDLRGDGTLTAFLTPAGGTDLQITGVFSDGRIAGARMYAAPPRAIDITTADFNKDGKPDVATAGFGNADADVGVWLSRSGGGFDAGPRFKIGGSPIGAAAGDFDGDGNVDLAVAPSSAPRVIKLLRGNGSGAFQNPTNTTLLGEPLHIVSGEFKGDGRADLAVSVRPNSGAGNVSIFLGGAAGTFTASGNLIAGNRPRYSAVGDLNGDSRADLVVADEGTPFSDVDPGGVFVFLGKGDGTFQNGVRYGGGLNPSSAAIGNLNQDGSPDVAITTAGPSFSWRTGVLLGQGAGALGQPAFQTVTDGPTHVAINDFDKDGKNDLLVTHCCGDVSPAILRGAGNGTFGAEEFFAAVGDAPRAAVADFNADSYPDIAFASNSNINGGGAMAVLLNLLGPGQPQAVATSVNGAGFQPGLAVAPDSIVSAFGQGLATGIEHASTIPLPTSMLGTSVTVRDSQGVTRNAGLITVTPGQVNYVMPAGTAAGLANVTVNSGTGATIPGTVQVAATGPGIFKASPTTLAVGSALRIQPGDVRTETGLVRLENGQFVPQPVNMGNAPD